MTSIGVLHDDLASLGTGLVGCANELQAALRGLRDVEVDEVAPARSAAAVDGALQRLGRLLESLSTEAADASRVVTRELGESLPESRP